MVVPCAASLSFGSISSSRVVCFGFTCLPHAGGELAGPAHSHGPRAEFASGLKGARILQLALACCYSEFTFGQSCLLPSHAEGYSGGPLSHASDPEIGE